MGLRSAIKRAAVEQVHALFTIPPLEAALARLTNHRDISDPIARLAPVNASYQHPAYRNVERHGCHFKLDISDYQDWLVYWGITTDRPHQLYSLIKPDDIVFDVGSNIGEVCMNAATLAGPGGLVYAFEPDPISFRKLTTNLGLNRFANIFASNLGLGEAPATLNLRVACPTNRGGNRIAPPGATDGHIAVVVETLDRFVAQRNIARLDVIKVDVEGFELSVLKGARETLARFRPRLFIEMADANLQQQGVSAAQMLGYLRDAGYRVFHAATEDELLPTSPLPPHCDVICRPVTA